MSFLAPLATIAGVGLQAKSMRDAKKAAGQAVQAAEAAKVDIPALNAQVVSQSIDNARRSAALERELSPELVALRQGGLRSLLSSLDPSAYDEALNVRVFGELNRPDIGDSALSVASRARAMEELNMGGDIPLDVRNLITRRAAATAAGVGGGGLEMGRDIRARDLGLTSLDLRRQRLAQAAELGGAEDEFNLARGYYNTNRVGTLAGLMRSLLDNPYEKAMGVSQLGLSQQAPQVGLDPSSVANIAVGNSNLAAGAGTSAASINAARASALGQFGGGLAGWGLSGIKPRQAPVGPVSTNLPSTTWTPVTMAPLSYGLPGRR